MEPTDPIRGLRVVYPHRSHSQTSEIVRQTGTEPSDSPSPARSGRGAGSGFSPGAASRQWPRPPHSRSEPRQERLGQCRTAERSPAWISASHDDGAFRAHQRSTSRGIGVAKRSSRLCGSGTERASLGGASLAPTRRSIALGAGNARALTVRILPTVERVRRRDQRQRSPPPSTGLASRASGCGRDGRGRFRGSGRCCPP